MTLKYPKKGIPDNRMVEYDQAVVKLGIKKSQLEGEVLRLTKDIDLKNEQKIKLDNQLEEEKKIVEVAQFLTTFEVYNDLQKKLDEKIKESRNLIEFYDQSKLNYEKESKVLDSARSELKRINLEFESRKNELNEDLRKQKNLLIDLSEQTELKKKELSSVVDNISDKLKELKSVVSDIEGKREEQIERERVLYRKERDLNIYEKRVEKKRQEVGITEEMKFI